MKPETECIMRAYLEVFREFAEIWRDGYIEHPETEYIEAAKLFEIAMNDKMLGELLREEILTCAAELKQEEEQARQAQAAEAEEVAEDA